VVAFEWYARRVRALSVRPGQAGSLAVSEFGEPPPSDGQVLVDVVAVGICGTDIEIVAGDYGEAPPGHERLVLGHESLGRVVEAPGGTPVTAGDFVVAMVRHPDPVPCENCATGRWDMCRNGRYTEHGIKGIDGFMRERYRVPVERLVKVDAGLGANGVLLEPTSVLAKAWTEVDRFATRAAYQPRVVLVTGAGPIGLLAALLGTQRGLEVHVLDRVTEGVKPALVRDLGATYHATAATETGLSPDVVIECTGVPSVVIDAMSITAVDGITCLTGVSATQRAHPVDVGALNREIVLENDIIFGSVNAARVHYEAAAEALARADRSWLERLITRRVAFDRYADALRREPDDVKVVLDFSAP
jgi:threonine dehydrogenase-like Zn-dependent dehydrogenase